MATPYDGPTRDELEALTPEDRAARLKSLCCAIVAEHGTAHPATQGWARSWIAGDSNAHSLAGIADAARSLGVHDESKTPAEKHRRGAALLACTLAAWRARECWGPEYLYAALGAVHHLPDLAAEPIAQPNPEEPSK